MATIQLNDEQREVINSNFRSLCNRLRYHAFNQLPVEPDELYIHLLPENIRKIAAELQGYDSRFFYNTHRMELMVPGCDHVLGVRTKVKKPYPYIAGWDATKKHNVPWLSQNYQRTPEMLDFMQTTVNTVRAADHALHAVTQTLQDCKTLGQVEACLPGLFAFIPGRSVKGTRIPSYAKAPPYAANVILWFAKASMLDSETPNTFSATFII